jgi:TPR repeat protein
MDNKGIAGPVDQDKAVKRIVDAASTGYAPAQLVAGRIYMIGKVVPEDIAVARAYLTKAAASGNKEAALLLGTLLATRFDTSGGDREQAYVWLRRVRPHVADKKAGEVDALLARLSSQLGPAKTAELDARASAPSAPAEQN